MIWFVACSIGFVVVAGLLAGWLWPRRVEDGALPEPDPGRLPIQVRLDLGPCSDAYPAAFEWAQAWWGRQIEGFSPFAPSRLPGAIARVRWASGEVLGAAMVTRHRLRLGRLISSEVLIGGGGGATKNLRRRQAAHELGHLLGLDEAPNDRGDVMSIREHDCEFALSSGARAWLRRAYLPGGQR